MSENQTETPRDPGPHQHAHAAPTTQQIRTVGQRRREAEEKLEHHLEEARHKGEHHDAHDHQEHTTDAATGGKVDGGEVAAIQKDDKLTASDRVDLIANQVVPEPGTGKDAPGDDQPG